MWLPINMTSKAKFGGLKWYSYQQTSHKNEKIILKNKYDMDFQSFLVIWQNLPRARYPIEETWFGFPINLDYWYNQNLIWLGQNFFGNPIKYCLKTNLVFQPKLKKKLHKVYSVLYIQLILDQFTTTCGWYDWLGLINLN